MTTVHLTPQETEQYSRVRRGLKDVALDLAASYNQRFVQIVAVDGRILDVYETSHPYATDVD